MDFRELIARDDIDAVSIATPDQWHAIQTIAAVNSGKDVYCEKPLTHNVHESVEVMKAVKKNKAILQTGSMQRSSREFRVACELVRNGVIGKVERTAVNVGPPGVPCDLKTETMEPGLDWEKWIGPGPMRGYSSVLSPRGVHGHFPHWRNYKEYGGGMVCDWGAHMIDIVNWGLGVDDSGPVGTIPAENPKAMKGAQLVYAGNVPLMHGTGMGSSFYGTEGRVECHRGRIGLWLGEKFIAGRTGGDRNINLGKGTRQDGVRVPQGCQGEAVPQQQPYPGFPQLDAHPQEAVHARDHRRAHCDRLSSAKPDLLQPHGDQVEPEEEHLRLRRRPQVADPRLPRRMGRLTLAKRLAGRAVKIFA